MDTETILNALRENTGFPWASHLWEMPPSFPYGVLLVNRDNALSADNRRYLSVLTLRIELYDTVPNDAAEQVIESWLNQNFPAWRTTPREPINPDDDTSPIWATAYEFEVIPNAEPDTEQSH